MTIEVRDAADGAIFGVKVVPGSSRTAVAGELGGLLKVQVAAAPEKGKANAAVCELLGKVLGVGKKAVRIVSGTTNARKQVEVAGVSAAEVKMRLEGMVNG